MRQWIATCGALAVMSTAGWISQDVQNRTAAPAETPGLEAHETHASASLIGQFRTSINAWLWLRTDLYLHNGVEMRPMTEAEQHQGESSQSSDDGLDAHIHGEGSVTTVIPAANKDFRGLFGDVERASSSWKDMHAHTHNNPEQALPLYRLMTWIDPHFVAAYTTGAAILAWGKSPKSVDQALAYLDEGRTQNPFSVAIYREIGQIQATKLHQLQAAATNLETGRKLGHSSFTRLDDDEKEALQDIYRWLGIIYQRTERMELMRQVVREGKTHFPDDGVLDRLLQDRPLAARP